MYFNCSFTVIKVSAKESRKRKQGYVDGLERRVKLSTQENSTLKKKVDTLEQQNGYDALNIGIGK